MSCLACRCASCDQCSFCGYSIWHDFTRLELERVATLLCNGIPMCCEKNQHVREFVTDDADKRWRLSQHAYYHWGCKLWQDDSGPALARREKWLNEFLETVGFSPDDWQEDILAAEQRDMRRARKAGRLL